MTDISACSSESEESEAESPTNRSERPRKPPGNPWLLQAAEMVFSSPSVSPDVLTEEPVGERRPLILAALAEAIDIETSVKTAAKELTNETNSTLSECQKTLQRTYDEAFDLVRLLLARGASLSVPSEKGIFPLEYAIKKHSMRVCISLMAFSRVVQKKFRIELRVRADLGLHSYLLPEKDLDEFLIAKALMVT